MHAGRGLRLQLAVEHEFVMRALLTYRRADCKLHETDCKLHEAPIRAANRALCISRPCNLNGAQRRIDLGGVENRTKSADSRTSLAPVRLLLIYILALP
jgi:hypothetical protein